MGKTGKILILYYEVMGYILAGLEAFAKQYPEIEVHVFELDHNKITTFQFIQNNFFYYKKSSFSAYTDFHAKCISINPDILVVSGRSDKHYLQIAKVFAKSIYTVTIQDTQIINKLSVKIQSFLSYSLYRRYFKGFWGCGKYGAAFGYAMGFEKKHIYNYAYSADTTLFSSYSKNFSTTSSNRTILFAGRLVKQKNILALVSAFIACNNERLEKWKLVIVGEGPLKDRIPVHNDIKLYGFSDAATLAGIAQSADIFCLPSIEEPWGVVVHEFASMGLALLLSERCGSAYEFLIEGYNGFMFNPGKKDELKQKLQMMMSLDVPTIKNFGENSIALSGRITSALWAHTLFSIYVNGKQFFPQKKMT